MRWIISRDGVVICVTSIPYDNRIFRDMKEHGYKIKKEEKDNG